MRTFEWPQSDFQVIPMIGCPFHIPSLRIPLRGTLILPSGPQGSICLVPGCFQFLNKLHSTCCSTIQSVLIRRVYVLVAGRWGLIFSPCRPQGLKAGRAWCTAGRLSCLGQAAHRPCRRWRTGSPSGIMYHVTSRHVTSRHVTSCHVTSRHVTSRHVTSRHVT